MGTITIAVHLKTHSGFVTLIDEDNKKEVIFKEGTELVEILFEQEKLAVEWAILDLVFIYGYTNIDTIEIIKYWRGEARPELNLESSGVGIIETRSDIRVLSKRYSRKKLNKKSVSAR